MQVRSLRAEESWEAKEECWSACVSRVGLGLDLEFRPSSCTFSRTSNARTISLYMLSASWSNPRFCSTRRKTPEQGWPKERRKTHVGSCALASAKFTAHKSTGIATAAGRINTGSASSLTTDIASINTRALSHLDTSRIAASSLTPLISQTRST